MAVYSNNMKVKLKKLTQMSKHAYCRLIFYKDILQFQCISYKTSLYILTYSKKSLGGFDLGSPIIGISVYLQFFIYLYNTILFIFMLHVICYML